MEDQGVLDPHITGAMILIFIVIILLALIAIEDRDDKDTWIY